MLQSAQKALTSTRFSEIVFPLSLLWVRIQKFSAEDLKVVRSNIF